MTRRELPDIAAVPLPPTRMLHGLRPVARSIFRWRFGVEVHGADVVPATGPVLLASNHIGVVDGPFLAAFSPRPVHALTKEEMFRSRLGGFLRHTGQIPLDRFAADPAAIKALLAVLAAGRAGGIFPEGTRGPGDFRRFHAGAAYLGLVSGAPVVPVTMLGTRAPGASSSSLPPSGGPVDIVFGEPYGFEATGWPRTREQVREASLLLREHMVAQLQAALDRTGRSLPGPLPVGQRNVDDDPHTGVVEQGA